ncbi:hypothetical protein ABDI30_22275 [Paenibacillus cisolokensis]|uniref:hypothetical protein n=1 Tax=Paenibacillus cisolokensis TaxID=1658519 RepID=UPI003D286E8D
MRSRKIVVSVLIFVLILAFGAWAESRLQGRYSQPTVIPEGEFNVQNYETGYDPLFSPEFRPREYIKLIRPRQEEPASQP